MVTSGRPEVELLQVAASLERDSEHPIARGIRAAFGGELLEVEAFRAHPGGGVSGVMKGSAWRLGSEGFLGVSFGEVDPDGIAVGLADEAGLQGVFVLGDRLRIEAPAVVAELEGQGLRLHLLTGDRAEPAGIMARSVGIHRVIAGVRPEGKLSQLKTMQSGGAVVGFVGDGVNDAPALAQADCGIAMGSGAGGQGTGAAMAAAPLVLLRTGLEPILTARRLALRTQRIIRQNLGWALGYNLLLVPLAAFGQLERFGGPILAGAAISAAITNHMLSACSRR